VKIEELGLSVRPENVLINNEGIKTVEELIAMPREWLLRCPNLGRKSLLEIDEALAKYGFKLTSKEDNYPGWLSDLQLSPLVKYRVDAFGWTLEQVLEGPRSRLLKAGNFGLKSVKDLEVALVRAGYRPKWSAPKASDRAQALFDRADLLEAKARSLRDKAREFLAIDRLAE
jgi:hypothetical protein